MPTPRGGKEERALLQLFEAPFPAAQDRHSPRSATGCSDPPSVDIVEQKSSGLRLEYSKPTAQWLTRVVDAPHDFALVYNFLNALLSDSDQPLGSLARRFSSSYDQLFLPEAELSRALTQPTPGKCVAPRAPRSRLAVAASAMQLGVYRIHQLCLDVLPPLQCIPASQAAMEAVQAALFELCGPTLHALVMRTVTGEDMTIQVLPPDAGPGPVDQPDHLSCRFKLRVRVRGRRASRSSRACTRRTSGCPSPFGSASRRRRRARASRSPCTRPSTPTPSAPLQEPRRVPPPPPARAARRRRLPHARAKRVAPHTFGPSFLPVYRNLFIRIRPLLLLVPELVHEET